MELFIFLLAKAFAAVTFVECAVFAGYYSRYNWTSTKAGRAVMLLAISTALVALTALSLPAIPLYCGILEVTAFGVMAFTMMTLLELLQEKNP